MTNFHGWMVGQHGMRYWLLTGLRRILMEHV